MTLTFAEKPHRVDTTADLEQVTDSCFVADLFTTYGGELDVDSVAVFETVVSMAVGSEVHLG